MDRKNILLIIIIILVAAGIFVIKRFTGKSSDCPKMVYTISSASILAGETIHFEDNSQEANEWKWDFGDGGTSDQQSGDYTYNTGRDEPYTITLTINGKCSETTSIKVGNVVITSGDTTQKSVAIIGPSSCKVGDPVQFTNNTPGATKWEWMFGESGNADKMEQNPTYTYNKPGVYTVVLRVDASKMEGRHQISVSPKPNTGGGGGGAAAPAKISGEQLRTRFVNITKGNFDTEYYDMLKKYFCDNDHVDVMVNSKKMSIYSYCMQLEVQRNTQINDVKVDYTDGCISKVTVNQKNQ
jgi:PKD repeat protein